jgi:glutathione S-transferase
MCCFIVVILLSNALISMLVNDLPVFYSFRRCPYAIRTRMVINHSRIAVELREVLLSNKPKAMLAASPKGTVPVLV